jgi:hypothetical protein
MAHRVNEEKVVWRVVDGEAVLLHSHTSAYYGLNRVGTLLWEMLVTRALDSEALLTWARRQFPNAPDELAGDLAEFLAQLEAFDLLETAPSAAGNGAMSTNVSPIPYQPPQITQFGELEKLILSGE